MWRLALTLGLAVIVAATGAAADSHHHKRHRKAKPVRHQENIERSLQKLAPAEQIVQLCDYRAMQEVRKADSKYRPDHAVADAMGDPTIEKNVVVAKGGAFRSQGKWYALEFRCTASLDNMKVISFTYKIGDEIPENKWTAYGLYQ